MQKVQITGCDLAPIGHRFLTADSSGSDLLALLPDDAHHVGIAEADDECRDDEDVGSQEGEVGLALPPVAVAAAQTLVLDLAVRIHADRHLRSSRRRLHDAIVGAIGGAIDCM